MPRKRLIGVYSNTSAYFAICYFFVTFITGFLFARYLMMFSAIILFAIAYMAKKNVNEKYLSYIFISICHFITFSLCFFSGGCNSPVLDWIALAPALTLLLLGNKAALLNLGISILLAWSLFFIDTNPYFPTLQLPKDASGFFNLQLAIGLACIIFITVRIFSERNLSLQIISRENIRALTSAEEELKQNIEELASTQNWLSETNHKLEISLKEQAEINSELNLSRHLIEGKKERQSVYNKKLSSITKGNFLYSGDLDRALFRLMEESAKSLETNRASIWYFNEGKNAIICKVQYDLEFGDSGIGAELHKHDFPIYMQAILNENTIIAPDARKNAFTHEFTDIYFTPNNIYSLLDIPLFVDGNNIGVICFEHKNTLRNWSDEDISFAQSIVDLTAITIYSSQKRNSMLEIENQYKQIVEQKAKLELMGQQLKMTNAHLEEKVIDRTRELEEKNTHLAEYTFINVHLLRGPLCRIIGLTNLMSLEQHKEETIHLLNLLKESNTELEQLIKKITIVLEAGEALNRNTLQ